MKKIIYFKTLNNRPWGANNESLGGPGGPGTGFCSPGGGFSGSRRSGKPLRLLRLKNHPQDHQNHYQDHQDHPGARFMGCLLWVVNIFLIDARI